RCGHCGGPRRPPAGSRAARPPPHSAAPTPPPSRGAPSPRDRFRRRRRRSRASNGPPPPPALALPPGRGPTAASLPPIGAPERPAGTCLPQTQNPPSPSSTSPFLSTRLAVAATSERKPVGAPVGSLRNATLATDTPSSSPIM